MGHFSILAGVGRLARAGLVATLAVLAAPVFGQEGAATIDPTVIAPARQAVADGFRSAKFGMTREEVREAIASDFGIEGEDVVEGLNRAERTNLLSVLVPDLLPDGGVAQVSYVFGYRSEALIQVGISWNAAVDPALTEEMLYSNADALAAHFMAAGYVPDTVTTGLVLDAGILLFRGEDTAGHATILLLQGEFVDMGEGQQGLSPSALAVLYAADAENPDVFAIEPGQF